MLPEIHSCGESGIHLECMTVSHWCPADDSSWKGWNSIEEMTVYIAVSVGPVDSVEVEVV